MKNKFYISVFFLQLFLSPSTFGQEKNDTASLVEKLSALTGLYEQGVISDDEFNAAKRRLFNLPEADYKVLNSASDQGSDRNISSTDTVYGFSNHCLNVFEQDINLVRQRSNIIETYKWRILPHALSAMAEGTDGKNPKVEASIRDRMLAERDGKLNEIRFQKDTLQYENTDCFSF